MRYKKGLMVKCLANFDSTPYSSFLFISLSLFFFNCGRKESIAFTISVIYWSISGVPTVVQLMFYLVPIANFREASVKKEFLEGLDLADAKGKNFQAQRLCCLVR